MENRASPRGLNMSDPRSPEHFVLSAEQLFGPLVDQALVGIYLIQDNRFAYVNPRLAELFATPPRR